MADLLLFTCMNTLRALLRDVTPNTTELRRLEMINPRGKELLNPDRAAHLFWIAIELRRVAAAATVAAEAFDRAGHTLAVDDGRNSEQAEHLRASTERSQAQDPR